MQPGIFIGGLVFSVIVLGGLFLVAHLRGEHMEEINRLAKQKRKLSEKEGTQEADIIFADIRSDYLGKLLAEAGLESQYDEKKTQWIVFSLVSAFIFALVFFFISQALSIVGFFFGLPIGAAAFVMWIRLLAKKRQDRMTEQLPQILESMVSSLRAGSPIIEVFKMLAETAPEPIRTEFKRALISLQLGKAFRDVLNEMCLRIRTPDFRLISQAIFISQDVGGNLADVVATIAEAIRERFKLRDFLNSLTAQGKFTAVFIGLLPYLITLMLFLSAPSYMTPFFNHPIARLIFIGMIFWEFVGFYILMRLTTFDV
jgi:tight adherence protein B